MQSITQGDSGQFIYSDKERVNSAKNIKLKKYISSSRGGGHHMDTPNLSAGLLGPIPMSQGHSSGGMPSSWGKHWALEQVNYPHNTHF